MKKINLITILFLAFNFQSFANNLVIGAPVISGSTLTFTIKWDNSWNVATGPSNWDAVWIFVKRQTCNQPMENPWIHAQLSGAGHSITGSQLQVDMVSDNAGVFVRRNSAGIGNINEATLTITLDSAIGTDNIGVYGIEMVNVPQGDFYVGDGATGTNAFTAGNTDDPLLITAAHQSAGIGAVSVYQRNNLGSSVALPATFPLGHNRFYCMKYEITIAQYVSFLNTLKYNQQLKLHQDINVATPSSPIGTVFNAVGGYRIEIKTPGETLTSLTPAVYASDSTDDDAFDQDNDALGYPASFKVKDFTAYLDWAALRPMTEFEYEKACRGPVAAVVGEYAWGTTVRTGIGSRNNLKQSTESLPGNYFGPTASGAFWRVGITATNVTDRVHAGATYYGIMDMSGNAFERCVGGWSYDYSTFTTLNGDGNITNDADANVVGWPSSAEHQYSRRGASFAYAEGLPISYRGLASWGDTNIGYGIGGRGVRSW